MIPVLLLVCDSCSEPFLELEDVMRIRYQGLPDLLLCLACADEEMESMEDFTIRRLASDRSV